MSSKDVLDVAVRHGGTHGDGVSRTRRLGITLVRWLTKRGHTAVVLEATGTYSFDVALALHRARGIEVMVANPRAIKQFTGALMQRFEDGSDGGSGAPRVCDAHAVRGLGTTRGAGARAAGHGATYRRAGRGADPRT
jgi:hypothetical protein